MLEGTPAPPDWRVEWEKLSYHWLEPMKSCPQSPRYHAEGNVWIHTRMVCQALASLPRFRALPESDREILWAAALLHDVAKPACTRPGPDGQLTSAGHARRGAVMARRILWQLDAPSRGREAVCALIRHHMVPFWVLERPDPRRLLLEVSQTTRCDLLSILAEADARGRVADDQAELIEDALLFEEFAREHGCLTEPYRFPSDHTRYLYFRSETRSPEHEAFEETRSRVVVMSGLPGSGKDTHVCEHLVGLPMISLDELRREMDVRPTDDQSGVANRARELAREHLRARRDFVWNATNLSRDHRERVLGLLADYHARIRIVYCETSCRELMRRNEARDFPAAALDRLLDRWEVPDLTEAHELLWAKS